MPGPCTVRFKLIKFEHVWETGPCTVKFKLNRFTYIQGEQGHIQKEARVNVPRECGPVQWTPHPVNRQNDRHTHDRKHYLRHFVGDQQKLRLPVRNSGNKAPKFRTAFLKMRR